MTVDRTVRLSPDALALKAASREAVKAAGGQMFVASECGRSQPRISDYLSPCVADFMPIDVAARIEALSVSAPGWPHITRALARQAGGCFVPLPEADAAPALLAGRVMEIMERMGRVAGATQQALADGVCSPTEAQGVRGEVAEAIAALVGFDRQLQSITGER